MCSLRIDIFPSIGGPLSHSFISYDLDFRHGASTISAWALTPAVNNFTKINYEIPNGVSKAEMLITDQLGRTIKQIALNTFGKGTLNVDTKGLSYGTYNYTLLADGKMVDTKKMVVVK